MAARPEIHVIAGALFDADGRVLIAQRPSGRHMAGRWEFPGGKLDDGEDPFAGLKRELAEELGVDVRAAEPLIRLRYHYPDRSVLLDVWRVTDYRGEPRALDAQALDWAAPDELPDRDLLEADRAIVTALRLPPRVCVVDGTVNLAEMSSVEPQTILWQLPDSPGLVLQPDTVREARAAGHRIFVLGDGVEAVRCAALAGADGAVLRWRGQNLHVAGAGRFLIGVLCEDMAAGLEATEKGAQFLVVAAGAQPMPEHELDRLQAAVGIPVFNWCRLALS